MSSGLSVIAPSSVCVAGRRCACTESARPFGHRSPKGRLRRYLVEVPYGRFWSRIADDAPVWLGSVMDSGHVVRSSTAMIEGGVLHVTADPLTGMRRAPSRSIAIAGRA